MAKACDYCGKARHKASRVSHSSVKTRKWQQPNLQSVRALIEGQIRNMTACTRCIRSGRVVKAA
ncbi:MAG: 50S ribosomal protein L28 [Myxococcota bacterium]